MQEKIQLIKNDGTMQDIKVVSLFSLKIQNEDRKFALLTFNELDPNGLVKILASEVGDANLIKITEDSIWNEVKNVMRSVISGSNGDFSYVNVLDINSSFVVDDDFARVIAVQEAAMEALSKAYQDNKPEAVEKAPLPEEEPVDPNQAIYPEGASSEDNSSIEEVTPSDVQVPEQQPAVEPTFDPEEQNDEPTFNTEEPVAEPTFDASESTFNSEESSFEAASEYVPQEENIPVEQPSYEAPVVEAPVVENESSLANTFTSEAKAVLMQEITAAVDKYIAEINKNNDLLKSNISKMQEELNKINEAINTSN